MMMSASVQTGALFNCIICPFNYVILPINDAIEILYGRISP